MKEKVIGYSRLIWRTAKGFFIERVIIDGLTFDVSDLPARIRGIDWNIWEQDNRRLVKKYIEENDRVVELGGGIGIVSCFINKQLKDTMAHLVVEANPDIISIIAKNAIINNCLFTVVNKVYGNSIVYKHEDFYRSSTQSGDGEAIQVEALSFADLQDFNVLVSDIEGAEIDILTKEDISHFDTLILEIDRVSDRKAIDLAIEKITTHKKVEDVLDNPVYSFIVLKKICA